MTILRTGLITAVLAVAPTYLAAQEASTTPAPASAPAEAAAPSEAQQIQARLGQIQQQAMQDPEVQAAFKALNDELENVDAEFKALTARAETLKADVAAAQAAQDNAKLHELAAEAKQLQTALPAARARATQNPDVKDDVAAFRAKLVQKMQQLDPEVQNLVARLAELRK